MIPETAGRIEARERARTFFECHQNVDGFTTRVGEREYVFRRWKGEIYLCDIRKPGVCSVSGAGHGS